MRITELRRRLVEHFGADWAPSYSKDFVMAELGGQTIDQALAMGMEPAATTAPAAGLIGSNAVAPAAVPAPAPAK